MIWAKNLNPLLLLCTATILYSFFPRFCTAQGQNSSSNSCATYGRCGAFGGCNSHESPICTCLQGFAPNSKEEWDAGNWTSGCERRVPLKCEGNNGTSNGSRENGFLKLQNLKISGYSDRWFGPEDECGDRCLRNCSCIAHGYDVGVGCMFWSGTLIDIQKFPSGSGPDLYIRVAHSELDRKRDNKKIIIVVVIVGLIIMAICAFFSWKWMAKKRGKKTKPELGEADKSDTVDSSLKDALSKVNLEELPLIKFEVLVSATDNFSDANKLGKGGFGPVYKGTLADGRAT